MYYTFNIYNIFFQSSLNFSNKKNDLHYLKTPFHKWLYTDFILLLPFASKRNNWAVNVVLPKKTKQNLNEI